MEPTPSDQQPQKNRAQPAVRPWERVRPSATKARQMRETFRPKAPSPADQVIARHDEELDDEPAPPPSADTVICF